MKIEIDGKPVELTCAPYVMPIEVEGIWIQAGTILRDYRPYSAITHKFREPGIYVVTVTGSAGNLPVTQKVKIVVRR
ncbi:MAG TPA: hypothetical protein VJJ98_02520 [Sedimentisphaerales bacterium]|nr:hypothetical protein [Sedimentisphaerales bacterium]